MGRSLRQGPGLIVFACRHPDGNMRRPATTRQKDFCPSCSFDYRGAGCIFTPAASNGVAFGGNVSAKPRREYAPRRKTTIAATGGRWGTEHILEVVIEFFTKRGEWPTKTTDYRDSPRLPHSSTVKRHFGSIEEAVRQAQELMEKEDHGQN